MGAITTGIGLMSGIDTGSLIDALIALESKPQLALQQRIAKIQSQQTAMLDINSRLLNLKNHAASFKNNKVFQSALAISSNPEILTAKATTEAQPGTYSFIVKQLVAHSQKLSKGFADPSTTPVGLESLTFAFGKGNLDRDRALAELNGGNGVAAGKILVTDKAGNQGTINLSSALTLGEVLDAINTSEDVNVKASLEGDGIVITDTSGGGGTLTVDNAIGSTTATDLGIVGSEASGVITGSNVNVLGVATALSWINDGTGVLVRNNVADLRITDRNGVTHDIDLGQINTDITAGTLLADLNNGNGVTISDDEENPDITFIDRDGAEHQVNLTGVTTVGGLIARVSNETGGAIELTVTDGNRLTVTDTTGGDGVLSVLGAGENGTQTAEDLGILNVTGVSESSFDGEVIPNTLQTPAATTLGEVIDRINEQTGGAVSAAIAADGVSLELTDNTGGSASNLIVKATAANPHAAHALGIFTGDDGVAGPVLEGSRLKAHLGSTMVKNINGGNGLDGATTLSITDRSGSNIVLNDLDTYHSITQIVDAINSSGVGVTASLNASKTGVLITDETGSTASNLIISGDAAEALGIEADAAQNTVHGSNLNLQHIGPATSLKDMNYGKGIGTGSFRITDGLGQTATINIGANQKTLHDVIQLINAQALAVNARINDTGDGLLLEADIPDGQSAFTNLKVEALSGTAAKDLNILGTAETVEDALIDGSYSFTLDFAETDTLNTIVKKINDEGIPVSASILNTGSGANPYRLNFTSSIGGQLGELIIDTGDFDLGLTTLSKGADAKVLLGTPGSEGFLLTSNTNSIKDVVQGVTLDLHAASDDPVTITVQRDTEKILEAANQLVVTFNDAIERIDQYDFFDVDTEEKGILLGNSTTARVRNSLHLMIQRSAEGVSTQYQFLHQVGITIGSGGKLTFDEAKFLEAFENDPTAVENLFAAFEETSTAGQQTEISPGVTVLESEQTVTARGLGPMINDLLESLTHPDHGAVSLADQNFSNQIDLLKDRVEVLQQRLEAKQKQLEKQFAGMENALAQLQGQHSALQSLASNVQLAANLGGV